MKILFFLLALANVAFFMWEYHKGAFVPERSNSADNSQEYPEQILLMSEFQDDQLQDKQTDKTETDSASLTELTQPGSETIASTKTDQDTGSLVTDQVDKNTISCYQAGPFVDERDFKSWEKRLSGFIKGVTREQHVISDYLVFYPASETLVESEVNLKMLKEKGVKDIWMIQSGEEQGQISFGVFDKEERAVTMKNELLAKGIDPVEIKPRYKTKVQKFAFIQGEKQAIENLEALKISFPQVPVIQTTGDEAKRCLLTP